MRVAIIGAGIMGRTLSWHLANRNYDVTLYEKNGLYSKNCSYAAAGMLSPYAEISAALPSLEAIGRNAICYWRNNHKLLPGNVFFDDHGTLCLASIENKAELQNFKNILLRKTKKSALQEVKIVDYEPEINNQFRDAIFLPHEAQISATQLMNGLAKELFLKKKVVCHANVIDTNQTKITIKNRKYCHDWVIDCRGLAAKSDFKTLRGVRGELLLLHSPTVQLKHVIRFYHPRHSIYILPRPRNHFIVGASNLDVEDYSPISVKTALTLLSTVYAIHKGFAEARIIATSVHCRPAFEENLPRLYVNDEKKLIRINGLYRHGFLFAPFFAETIELFLENHHWPDCVKPFLHNET
jgi:glycine oxidase